MEGENREKYEDRPEPSHVKRRRDDSAHLKFHRECRLGFARRSQTRRLASGMRRALAA